MSTRPIGAGWAFWQVGTVCGIVGIFAKSERTERHGVTATTRDYDMLSGGEWVAAGADGSVLIAALGPQMMSVDPPVQKRPDASS